MNTSSLLQAGNYDGPPLQYTATTALQKDHATGLWDLAPGFKVFSNEHDPRLKEIRKEKAHKVTRYVFPEHSEVSNSILMTDFQVSQRELEGCSADSVVTAQRPDTGESVEIRIPSEYKNGDRIRVRVPRADQNAMPGYTMEEVGDARSA